VVNGDVAFALEWDDEEGEARLSLDDREREIVSTSWEGGELFGRAFVSRRGPSLVRLAGRAVEEVR
jgi:hypothetical protein